MYTIRVCLGAAIGAALLGGTAYAQDKPTSKLTEAQAVGVTIIANAHEVGMGQIVAARTTDPKVRAYAMKLVDEHLSANRELLGYIEQSGTLAADSPTRDKLLNEGYKAVGQLWTTQPGPALDKMFLTEAVADHVEDLDLLDNQLIPAAQNPQLKASLTKMRGVVAQHLDEACQLAQPMGIQAKGCEQRRGTE